MKVSGHVWYVTGASSGLGRATTLRLAERGGFVAALDMNEDAGEELAKQLGESKCIFTQADVRSEEDVERAIEAVNRRWGDRPIGGLVHCGGVGMAGKTLNNDGTPSSLDVFKEVVDINLTGTFNMARLVAAQIVQRLPPNKSKAAGSTPEHDNGVLVFVSSVSYEEGQMGQVAYASSKAGVVGLTLPMARDLARYGIRVVTVAPSLFSTAMGANVSDKVRQSLLNNTLFPSRFGQAEEFAHLATSIIENTYLNGTVIRIDGGGRMSKF